jgi:hypothetical protein
MIQDLHDGVRMLIRHPRSTLLIVGLLALGIGTSAVVFSLFDAVLLRPLPVRNAEVFAVLFVAITAGVATLYPVLRAIRTEPSETLRREN